MQHTNEHWIKTNKRQSQQISKKHRWSTFYIMGFMGYCFGGRGLHRPAYQKGGLFWHRKGDWVLEVPDVLIDCGNYNSCFIVPQLGPSRVSILFVFSNCRFVVIGINTNISPIAVFVQYVRGKHSDIPAYEVYIHTHFATFYCRINIWAQVFKVNEVKVNDLLQSRIFMTTQRVSLIKSINTQYHIPEDHQREFTLHMILSNKTYSEVKRLKRCV
jgi:hypothetical protein